MVNYFPTIKASLDTHVGTLHNGYIAYLPLISLSICIYGATALNPTSTV